MDYVKKRTIFWIFNILLKFPKHDMFQNSNQSHYIHNAFGNNILCLTDGNDILLEVVHDRRPKSLT
jgi:hypothetical protein